MTVMLFRCDQCKKEETRLGLPPGWLEARFYSPNHGRDYFYHFCGYACLSAWSEAREAHYGNQCAGAITREA